MRMGRSLAAGGFAALLLLGVGASAAFAYQGQVANLVTVTGPSGTTACNTPLTLTATVLDSHGLPVDNLAVVWTFGAGQLTGDQIVPTSTTTNASGVTTTTLTLACIAGNRTVVASAAPAGGQLVISPEFVQGATATPVASGRSVTPPPTVGSSPPGTTNDSTPLWAFALLGICLLLLLAVVVWSTVRRRIVAGD
jgi:hypothetical protein